MSLYALTKEKKSPTREEVDEAFDGNLCRCTGYRPILEGAMKVVGITKPYCGILLIVKICSS